MYTKVKKDWFAWSTHYHRIAISQRTQITHMLGEDWKRKLAAMMVYGTTKKGSTRSEGIVRLSPCHSQTTVALLCPTCIMTWRWTTNALVQWDNTLFLSYLEDFEAEAKVDD